MTEGKKTIVETISDNGETIKFELIDIVALEEMEYALLSNPEEDEGEIVIMRLLTDEDGGYTFESIDDDEEFDKISEYIYSLDEEDDEDED